MYTQGNKMQKFDHLLEVAEKLFSPDGCPWDREQTFQSLQSYVLEEVHEVIEAVDGDCNEEIVEELGDLLNTIIFYGKIAERAGRFTISDIIDAITEKLVRRHPHVFGENKIEHSDEVIKQWEKIKKEEKKQEQRKSVLDGLPPTLPTLIKAQKILKRILRSHSSLLKPEEKKLEPYSEQQIGEELIRLVMRAEEGGIDIESALRRSLGEYEKRFRDWELTN